MKPEIGKITTGVWHAPEVSAMMWKQIFIFSSQLHHYSWVVRMLSTGHMSLSHHDDNYEAMGVVLNST
jgi:hypothetical protein